MKGKKSKERQLKLSSKSYPKAAKRKGSSDGFIPVYKIVKKGNKK